MARTNRRREADDVTNSKRSIKKGLRRNYRKNVKRKLQVFDYKNPEAWDDYDDDEAVEYIKGYS